MKLIHVGIIDDSNEYCDNLKAYLNNQDNIKIEFVANDGFEGITKVKEHNVDVLLLDIVIPKLDGLALVEKLNNDEDLKYLPQIIIVSSVSQDIMINKAMELGAAYYMIKPVNFDILLQRIFQLSSPANSYVSTSKSVKSSVIRETVNAYELELYITNLLHEVGVPAHVKGYKYLKDAIKFVIEDMSLLSHITKELYPRVASINNSSALRVEKGIRTAILIAWDRGNKEIEETIFGYTVNPQKGKPTNSEFIALLADKIRLEILYKM